MTQENRSIPTLLHTYSLIEKASADISSILLNEINKYIKREDFSNDWDYTRAKHTLLQQSIKKASSKCGGIL